MTYDKELLKALWLEGVPGKEIGRRLGISKSSVSKHAVHILGLPHRELGSRSFSGKEAEDLYRQGWSIVKLGRKYKVSHTTVSRVLKHRGVTVSAPRVVGSPLTAQCSRLYRQGFRYREIAAMLGIHINNVGNRVRAALGSGPWGGARWTKK